VFRYLFHIQSLDKLIGDPEFLIAVLFRLDGGNRRSEGAIVRGSCALKAHVGVPQEKDCTVRTHRVDHLVKRRLELDISPAPCKLLQTLAEGLV